MRELIDTLFAGLDELTLIDPHTHIQPLTPASRTLADLMGYHYYTELVHSAGVSRERIEGAGLSDRDRVGRLVDGLEPLSNTVQLQWLMEIARDLFSFDQPRIDRRNIDDLYNQAAHRMAAPNWADQVLEKCKVSALFLTNDFDDALEGFDTQRYIPCLRTDDLVFHLARPQVRRRLEVCSGIAPTSLEKLREGIDQRFKHFIARGGRACAISLPPDFTPTAVSDAEAQSALEAVLKDGEQADLAHRRRLSQFVFWTLAQRCQEYRWPFDLMIGVNRQVYPGGVFQGQDLYDSRLSLIQYKELFNSFPSVTFPVSVLASVTNQELVSYSWIFPNVVPFGHWWYSNTPSMIERDLAHRLEAVPGTKLLGYYSDAYKLEFILPKFRMYKRVLAKCLAQQFVTERGWSEQRAIDLGAKLLRDNVERYFG